MSASSAVVLDYLRTQREALVEFLGALVLAESPSSEPGSQSRVRSLLATELEERGFATRFVAGRQTGGHLIARPRRRKRQAPQQLVIGHYDTVWPVGTLQTMPFEYDGRYVRGPGAFDMKGGLAALVFALRAIEVLGLSMSVVPVVLLNSDEEIGSRESTRDIERLARTADRALVLEPSLGPAGALKTARKGVGKYTITVKGRAAHAGLDPERGVSAILELSHVIQSLFALNDPARGVSVNVGTVDGGLRPNVIAPESRAVVDVRIAQQADAERIDAAIRGLKPTSPGSTLVVEGGIGRPALEPTPRNRALWELARRLGDEIGIELTEGAAGGGSDGNTTSLYTATLDGLGPVGDGAHAPHEHLDVDLTIERTALITMLLLAPPLAED
ncbi:MAG: M20 family metallopeptidase [Actinomycetia bacterium]|nr:M20 family metallopeptidase [Actinomycetes bacterium]